MLKSKSPLMAICATLIAFLVTTATTQAACPASVATAIPADPAEMGSVTITTVRAARLSTAKSNRSSPAAIAPGWSESAPDGIVALPASVSTSDPACVSDTFGAPLTAQAMAHARNQLAQEQSRLAQLRTLRQQPAGMQVHLTGNDQSRREGGDADVGTQALRVSRVDVTLGADYRLNDQWVTGGTIGLGNPRMRWDGDASRVDGQSGNVSAYALWSPSPASFLSAVFSLESTHYSLHTDDDFEHATTGINTGLSLSAGYDFQHGNWTLSPYARADVIASRIGSFGNDTGSNHGRTDSLSAGAQLQTSVPTNWGVIAPHARLEFTQITSWRIAGESAATYVAGLSVLPTPYPLVQDRQFGTFGIGASAVLQRGVTLFTDYDTGFAQKSVSSWRLTFGLRSEL